MQGLFKQMYKNGCPRDRYVLAFTLLKVSHNITKVFPLVVNVVLKKLKHRVVYRYSRFVTVLV